MFYSSKSCVKRRACMLEQKLLNGNKTQWIIFNTNYFFIELIDDVLVLMLDNVSKTCRHKHYQSRQSMSNDKWIEYHRRYHFSPFTSNFYHIKVSHHWIYMHLHHKEKDDFELKSSQFPLSYYQFYDFQPEFVVDKSLNLPKIDVYRSFCLSYSLPSSFERQTRRQIICVCVDLFPGVKYLTNPLWCEVSGNG